jgi:hypothetical protein
MGEKLMRITGPQRNVSGFHRPSSHVSRPTPYLELRIEPSPHAVYRICICVHAVPKSVAGAMRSLYMVYLNTTTTPFAFRVILCRSSFPLQL